MFQPASEEPKGSWKPQTAYRAHAKDGETVTTCPQCYAVVSIWDMTKHDEWHKLHDGGGGTVTKIWDALKRTNDRIDRLLNGVVRLK